MQVTIYDIIWNCEIRKGETFADYGFPETLTVDFEYPEVMSKDEYNDDDEYPYYVRDTNREALDEAVKNLVDVYVPGWKVRSYSQDVIW